MSSLYSIQNTNISWDACFYFLFVVKIYLMVSITLFMNNIYIYFCTVFLSLYCLNKKKKIDDFWCDANECYKLLLYFPTAIGFPSFHIQGVYKYTIAKHCWCSVFCEVFFVLFNLLCFDVCLPIYSAQFNSRRILIKVPFFSFFFFVEKHLFFFLNYVDAMNSSYFLECMDVIFDISISTFMLNFFFSPHVYSKNCWVICI